MQSKKEMSLLLSSLLVLFGNWVHLNHGVAVKAETTGLDETAFCKQYKSWPRGASSLYKADIEHIFFGQEERLLARAAEDNDARALANLIREGVPADSKGIFQITPLFIALRSGSLSTFVELLALGASPNQCMDTGFSVMNMAAQFNDPRFLKYLLEYGGNPNLAAGEVFLLPPLFAALDPLGEPGDLKKIEYLIEAGAQVDFFSVNGFTPITSAAQVGRFDIVSLLLDRGASVNDVDPTGKTLSDYLELVNDERQQEFLELVRDRMKVPTRRNR